ncbi:MAG: dihydroorotase [Omnitrophica WOR_2 bacterium RIFCSPLOWO2_12_FULL_51_24]|nr:MAG: dihydroorotase [Omnitrophica WOR_2 bacterium RIFCSPLOWO2_12_FULL_51_24]
MDILLKGGHVVDPANNIDSEMDVLIKDDKIEQVAKNIKASGIPQEAKTIDCKGKMVFPGLIDMHTHLRQPGREDEETFLTGSRAALKGGFTSVLCMANTNPVIDNKGMVEYVYSESAKAGLINIYPVAAVTKGLEGKELTEIGQIAEAGAKALSDDGKPVMNAEILRRALEYSKMFGLPVISHCEDMNLSMNGVMNEGFVSTKLGLKGIPRTSEIVMVMRDIELMRLSGARLHIAHVSAKESVEAVREAKKRGIKVTCETCPHYFMLTEDAVIGFNTNAKVNPPLRTKEDVEAIKKGLADGVIDVIATDHAPHSLEEKDVEFDFAAAGMIGLEFALSLANPELIKSKVLGWSDLIRRMAVNPAKIIDLQGKGSLAAGSDADVAVFDAGAEWVVEGKRIESRSKNTPLIGRKMCGAVVLTIVGGKIKYENGKFN